jgi:hypothetical protein
MVYLSMTLCFMCGLGAAMNECLEVGVGMKVLRIAVMSATR